ncbi:hypothetical protein V1514DRAFT_277983 [Lipomyces japonicus]|uniref:uncharacterized protein n=1 Tax=Lipomyces japonicus TaxID=56871 RepID=UPI0034CF9EE7
MPAARRLLPSSVPLAVERVHRGLATHHFLYAPLLNWVVIFTYLVFIVRLIYIFNDSVTVSPLVVMSVSNVLLYGLSDVAAQTVSTISDNLAISRRSNTLGLYNNEKPEEEREPGPFTRASSHLFVTAAVSPFPSSSFRIDSIVRFSTWGFLLSIVQFKWLEFLNAFIPMTDENVVIPVLLRVLFDQLFFTPIFLAAFFAFMTFTEGGDSAAINKKLSAVLVPTLKTNYMIWPAAQIINFRLIPLHFQLPFASTVGIFWNTWLSLANSQSNSSPDI